MARQDLDGAGRPAQESTGTSENKMILGGRYLEQHYDGTMMGQPFCGIGYGFDNYKKKYVATWIDSMGTGILVTTGHRGQGGEGHHVMGDRWTIPGEAVP